MAAADFTTFDPLMSPIDIMRGFLVGNNSMTFLYLYCLFPTILSFVLALLMSCCCCREYRELPYNVACLASVAAGVHIQRNLRTFVGIRQDSLLFPPPRDRLFVTLLVAPIVLYMLAVCSQTDTQSRNASSKPLLV